MGMLQLTEEESGDGALELEQIPDDGSAPARSDGGGVHCSDVGEALAVLCINGVPHQARSIEQCVLGSAAIMVKDMTKVSHQNMLSRVTTLTMARMSLKACRT